MIAKACFATGLVSSVATFSWLPVICGLVLGERLPAPFDWYVLVASGSVGLALIMPALALGILGLRLEGARSQPFAILGIALAVLGALASGSLWIA